MAYKYKLNTEVNFGKYKGKLTVKEIADTDPDYMNWLLDKSDFFNPSDEVLVYVNGGSYFDFLEGMSEADFVVYLSTISPDKLLDFCKKAYPSFKWGYRSPGSPSVDDKILLDRISKRNPNWEIRVEVDED